MRVLRRVLVVLLLATGTAFALLRVVSVRGVRATGPFDLDRQVARRTTPSSPAAPVRGADPAPRAISWAEPVDGACPTGFPVKAKVGSGIFHVRGGRSYERTSPDRCYATPAAAEADGYRPAKA